VTQFYDAEARLAGTYSGIIHLPKYMPAWDVYFVFDSKVRWENQPPAPTYWMHQLGNGPPDLRLDGAKMAQVVNGLLNAASRASGPSPPYDPDRIPAEFHRSYALGH
jgi:hypothetical protein